MRISLFAVVLVAMVAPVAATGDLASSGKGARGTVLALGGTQRSDFLVRLDGRSLRPVSRRLSLNGRSGAWAFSPDHRRLAIGVDRALGLRLIDARRLRNVARVETHYGEISFVAWLTARRIVGVEQTRIFVVDPGRRRLTRSSELNGWVYTARRAGQELVLLLAPERGIGPARVAVVDAEGAIRELTLDRIRAGSDVTEEIPPGFIGHMYRPGLAIDPGGRAFVVGAGAEPIAEVDLQSLRVTYRTPSPRRSLLGRLRDWLEPSAGAKVPVEGSARSALWVGDGRIAVWGYDSSRAGPDRVVAEPSGLCIVDTRDWTIGMVDNRIGAVTLVADTLLATGGGMKASGLAGYSLDGSLRYRLFGERPFDVVQTLGTTAYATSSGRRFYAVDGATGRILGTRKAVPQFLAQDFFTW